MSFKKSSTIPRYIQPNISAEEHFLDAVLPEFCGLNLSQQMEIFSKESSLTDVDYKERIEICAFISRCLRVYFPKCEVLMYGSTANGLGFRGCDLDLLFLSHPQYSNTPDDPEGKTSLKVRPKDIRAGAIPKTMLRKLDETSLLQFIKQAFYSVREIKGTVYIPAKHPILNFVVGKSSITCDLSASNRLVFYNSALLYFFLMIDCRVKPLTMCLRFWAKKLKFIKKGEFSSYAFTLLIIFFLQNTQPPILPSVKQLSDIAGYSRKVDGWECSFTQKLNGLHSQNTESLGVLLLKFFEFYWKFNFTSNVISTYIGSPIPLKDLLNFGDERLKQFEVSHICLQDLFILTKNVAINVTHTAIHSFKKTISEAYNMLQKEGNELQLTHFFNMKRFEYPKDSSMIVIHPSLDDLQAFENEYLLHSQIAWGIYKILDFVLLFECEVIDMSCTMPNSSFHLDVLPESINMHEMKESTNVLKNDPEIFCKAIDVELELLISIQCTTCFRTWFNRKNTSESINVKTNDELNPVLCRERSISDVILASDPLLVCPDPMFWFRCDVYKYNKRELPDIILMLVPLKQSKELTAVFTFLHSFLPKTVMNYLRSMKHSTE